MKISVHSGKNQNSEDETSILFSPSPHSFTPSPTESLFLPLLRTTPEDFYPVFSVDWPSLARIAKGKGLVCDVINNSSVPFLK